MNITLPRHYSQKQHCEMSLLFNRLISNACERTRSEFPAKLKYFIYTSKFDIEQEKIIVHENFKKSFLFINEKTRFYLDSVKDNGKTSKVFLYIKSILSENDTFDSLLNFMYNLLKIMQENKELSENLSDKDLIELSREINELILKK